jgi:hypothetical protein
MKNKQNLLQLKKFVHKKITKLFENYPPGTKNHPDAPWNQIEDEPEKHVSQYFVDIIAFFPNDEIAIIQDKEKKQYVFLYSDISKIELSKYSSDPSIETEIDEDGHIVKNLENWKVDEDAVFGYVNDYWKSFDIGYGYNDYESGDYDVIEIDGKLKKRLIDIFGEKIINKLAV